MPQPGFDGINFEAVSVLTLPSSAVEVKMSCFQLECVLPGHHAIREHVSAEHRALISERIVS